MTVVNNGCHSSSVVNMETQSSDLEILWQGAKGILTIPFIEEWNIMSDERLIKKKWNNNGGFIYIHFVEMHDFSTLVQYMMFSSEECMNLVTSRLIKNGRFVSASRKRREKGLERKVAMFCLF